jgi:PhoPQ-activated pathogenicity-related protein
MSVLKERPFLDVTGGGGTFEPDGPSLRPVGSTSGIDGRQVGGLAPALGALLVMFLVGCAHPPGHMRQMETALDGYVAAPDNHYRWEAVSTTRVDNVTLTAIDLTSQSWLKPGEVDKPVWRHWLMVARPDQVDHSTALLVISGGNNKDTKPPKPSDALVRIAQATRSVAAEVRMVPNQPLVFDGDGKPRVEDDLIAYGWAKYLRTGDTRWAARLPMTKSAVRAMDTITAFCASPTGGGTAVNTFVVAGGSKRGWTTWTTAAVDRRVIGICPIVIDLLNIVPSFDHHYRAYGYFAPAVDDYVKAGVMDWMGTPQFKRLMKLVEPYEYRDRFQMPKLLLNACGDQFFLPDSSQFYFDRLPGVKYLRYVPNADHSLRGSDAWETLIAWHHALVNGTPLPRFTWHHESPGTVKVKVTDPAAEVRLWQAFNPTRRDFRLETLGPVWTCTVLTDQGSGEFVGQVDVPKTGFTAYMVELLYPGDGPAPLKLTTDVRVVPDALLNDPYLPQPRHRSAGKR